MLQEKKENNIYLIFPGMKGRTMAIHNSVLWGLEDLKGDTSFVAHNICYANIFGPYSQITTEKLKTYPYFISLFRVEPNDFELSEWYRLNCLESFLPERIKSQIRFRPYDLKEYRFDGNKIGSKEKPWIKLKVECSKIDLNSLFILLTFLRFPQEVPDVIEETKLLYGQGCSLDASLFIANALLHENNHHSFVGRYTWRNKELKRNKLCKWNIKDIWSNMPVGPSLSESRNKTIEIEKLLTGSILKDGEFNGEDLKTYLLEDYNNAKHNRSRREVGISSRSNF